MSLVQDIISWIKEEIEKANVKGVVVGLSGGVDSSCVAVLCKMALGENVLGLILPYESSPEDEKFARLVAEKFNIKTEKIVLDSLYDRFLEILPKAPKMAKANLKPRLRMIALYYFANKINYLVAGCGNKSELSVGYLTKHGDGGADFLPLGGLLKTEVKELAKELALPEEIIKRVPSAGLWHEQTDEEELGLSYEDLDKAIIAIEKGTLEDFPKPDVIDKVKDLIGRSEHKRIPIPLYKKNKK